MGAHKEEVCKYFPIFLSFVLFFFSCVVGDEGPAGRDWVDLGEAESCVPGEGEGK